MPVREHVCVSPACDRRGLVDEHYFSRSDSQAPICAACGGTMRLLPSTFALPFLGPMTARYNDKKIAGSHVEGHFVTCKKTLSGKEELVWVDSWDKQKQVCKQEGLILPSDLPSTPTLKAGDSKSWSSVGMPGSWYAGAPQDSDLSSGRRLSESEIAALFPNAVST